MKISGKLDQNRLSNLFYNKLGRPSDTTIQGSSFGVDTGIIRLNKNEALIVASDPASFISSLGIKESAWLTVILTANDIATSGYLPEYAQFVLNLPHGISNTELEEYWNYIHCFCDTLGISITGGHTGFDNRSDSTLVGSTTMFAIGKTDNIKSSAFAKPGQDLILTKSAAISSATILAKSFPHHTKTSLGGGAYNCLVENFYKTSILSEVQLLQNESILLENISAMHDVTEGGSLGAIYELCEASQTGVKVDANKINVGQFERKICELFRIDPLRCIGAGSLLIACEKRASERIVKKLQSNKILATIVGETIPKNKGKKIVDSEGEKELEYWEEDPYWAAFSYAVEKGLR